VLTTLLLALAVGAAAVPATCFGINTYRVHQIKAALAEAVGRDSGYTETILKIESEASGMTFLELFQLCDKSIEDRTQLVVELRGLYPEIEYEVKEQLIDFLNSENELVRSKRAFYRHQLNLSTIFDRVQNLIRDTPSSSFERTYWLKRASEIREDGLESASEVIDAADRFSRLYSSMTSQEEQLAQAMEDERIRFRRIFATRREDSPLSLVSPQEFTDGALSDVVGTRL
jgi:hypothetical protein